MSINYFKMKKAMIFAAGLGTRLGILTQDRPKALVALKGKPLLQHVVERLVGEGFLCLTVNVHHFASQIIDYLHSPHFTDYAKSVGLQIQISDESDRLLDTGGGLKKAAPLLFGHNSSSSVHGGAPSVRDSDSVLIHNVDILSNAKLSRLYSSIHDADALLLVSQRETSRYLLFNNDMRMMGWENIKTGEVRSPFDKAELSDCRRLAFSGIHVVSKRLVDAMHDWSDKFGIMDFYIQSCGNLNIRGMEDKSLKIIDVGKADVLSRLEAQSDLSFSNL